MHLREGGSRMYIFTPQFQDLTEGTQIGEYRNTLKESLKNLKTEFIFGVAAPGQDASYLKDFGFKHLSTMNNWFYSHSGQTRPLSFYWLKREGAKNLDEAPTRKVWCGGEVLPTINGALSYGGCGFKLGVAPLSRKLHYQAFTLLRLPIEVSRVQAKLLKKLHYRHIDTGKLASYWINGWDPKEYSSAREYKFFGTKSTWGMNEGFHSTY
jgi:hypothetical protein